MTGIAHNVCILNIPTTRANVSADETPCHTNHHLCDIWKESIQNISVARQNMQFWKYLLQILMMEITISHLFQLWKQACSKEAIVIPFLMPHCCTKKNDSPTQVNNWAPTMTPSEYHSMHGFLRQEAQEKQHHTLNSYDLLTLYMLILFGEIQILDNILFETLELNPSFWKLHLTTCIQYHVWRWWPCGSKSQTISMHVINQIYMEYYMKNLSYGKNKTISHC